GLDTIRAGIAELTGYVRRRLSGERCMPAATPSEPKLHGAMAAFYLPDGTNAAELRRRLWEVHRIEVPIIERPRGLLIRVSTHFFNTEEEIDRLAEALKQC